LELATAMSEANSEYRYDFSRFDRTKLGEEIEFRCQNYRNPVFGQVLAGFALNVKDREPNPGQIVNYAGFALNTSPEDGG